MVAQVEQGGSPDVGRTWPSATAVGVQYLVTSL